MIVLRERFEGDAEQFESALHKAKKGIKEACEIFEDMKDEFSERRGYSERYSNRGGGYSRRDEEDWDEMPERRSYRRRGGY